MIEIISNRALDKRAFFSLHKWLNDSEKSSLTFNRYPDETSATSIEDPECLASRSLIALLMSDNSTKMPLASRIDLISDNFIGRPAPNNKASTVLIILFSTIRLLLHY